MVELTFTDKQDGTGGLFTISGTTGSAQNTLLMSRYHGSETQREFAVVGSRTGNGTVTFNGPAGCYMAHVASTNGTVLDLSTPKIVRVTDGAMSLYERVLEATREYVLSLGLVGVSPDPDWHIIAKTGAKLNEALKGSNEAVYYLPTKEEIDGRDNLYMSVMFPVEVVIYSKTAATLYRGLPDLLRAREELLNSFRSIPFDAVPEIHTVDVEPGMVVDPHSWGSGMEVSSMRFLCRSEQSGIFP